ncbi:hypothetical protein TcasGA2_TC014449 [Tribolium castaneum]|uniref:Uncharacterized protein n=1 Tax=Tribolium castaneum TaxID=7070 RepID=D6WM06_TRICA|nr:hypothetical protein TcasGA2_TC014449 [Tribolium castaneum]
MGKGRRGGVSTKAQTRSTVLKAGASRGDSGRVIRSSPEYIWCLFGIRITRRPWTYKDRNPSVNSFGPAAGGRRTCFVQQEETWNRWNLISSRLYKSLHYPFRRRISTAVIEKRITGTSLFSPFGGACLVWTDASRCAAVITPYRGF